MLTVLDCDKCDLKITSSKEFRWRLSQYAISAVSGMVCNTDLDVSGHVDSGYSRGGVVGGRRWGHRRRGRRRRHRVPRSLFIGSKSDEKKSKGALEAAKFCCGFSLVLKR